MRHRDQITLFGSLIVAVCGTPSAVRAASLEWLPEPIYRYGIDAATAEIAADGTVVRNCKPSPTDPVQACRLPAASGWQGLGFLPGHDSSRARGVSANGNAVVGRSISGTEVQAFRWTPTTGMTGLGFLPGANSSSAFAVSANGNVVAGFSGDEVFRWTPAGGMQGLGSIGLLPEFRSIQVSDMSEDGSVAVGPAYGDLGEPQAFRWTQADGMQALGFLPAPFDLRSGASAASADGSVVVGTSSGDSVDGFPFPQAFVWRQSCNCMRGLGFRSGATSSGASDISADGTIIVGSSGAQAVVWTSGRLQTLADILEAKGIHVPEQLFAVSAVSADGRWILGWSVREGLKVYFRAYIGPDFVGTDGPDTLIGTPGADEIDGMGGADVMTGLAGNDTYYVDLANDVVVEAANEGTDTVMASTSYTLPINVEKLILMGALEIDGSGNSGNNTLIGNSAVNVLKGKAGDDIIRGGAGNDFLIGSLGADTLAGGPGRDRFVFSAALGDANIDWITDFVPADDVVRLANNIFAALPGGTLAPSAFVIGTTATNAAHRILYDTATGDVRYDADGSGPAAAVRFVTLATKPALTSSDFYVQ